MADTIGASLAVGAQRRDGDAAAVSPRALRTLATSWAMTGWLVAVTPTRRPARMSARKANWSTKPPQVGNG
ncbi:MAG: hypothetical protein IPH44_26800 [Myxococcales bacterium]|nr:hypothetical protein [Myxococcales bacterium]